MYGFFSGLIVGSLMGVMAALWLAPQSGDKTQQLIGKQAHRLKHSAEKTVGDIKDSAEHASDDFREKVADARHDGQEWLDHQASKANKTATKIRNSVAQ